MPVYEYRCRECDTVFELRRQMADSGAPATCPDGHPDAVKLLSVFAATGRSAGGDASPAPAFSGGGGCGGACACHG